MIARTTMTMITPVIIMMINLRGCPKAQIFGLMMSA